MVDRWSDNDSAEGKAALLWDRSSSALGGEARPMIDKTGECVAPEVKSQKLG